MANYSNINQIIDNNIYANGNEEITGTILNNVLKEMVSVLGAGYQFMGACGVDTDPGTPDARVFYLATEAGTYSNFGGVTITDPTILYYDSTWHYQTLSGNFTDVNNVLAMLGYYECSTASGTAAKTITATDYVLKTGGAMKVKFANKNTAASGVTLAIGSTTAKPLYYNGAAVSASNTWEAGEVCDVYYDGTNYYANPTQQRLANAIIRPYLEYGAYVSAIGYNTEQITHAVEDIKFLIERDSSYRYCICQFNYNHNDVNGIAVAKYPANESPTNSNLTLLGYINVPTSTPNGVLTLYSNGSTTGQAVAKVKMDWNVFTGLSYYSASFQPIINLHLNQEYIFDLTSGLMYLEIKAEEVDQLSEEVDQLSEILEVQDLTTLNEIVKSDFTVTGKYVKADGKLGTSVAWNSTGFVPVSGGTEMETLLSLDSYSSSCLGFYSEANENSFISGVFANTGEVITGIAVPATAKYFRACMKAADTVAYVKYYITQVDSKRIVDLEEEVSNLNETIKLLPDFKIAPKIYCVAGDTNLIFTRGVVHAKNPYLHSLKYVCNADKTEVRPCPRYLKINFATAQNKDLSLQIIADDNTGSQVQNSQIIVKSPSEPQNNINVLCFGSSTTTNGVWAGELKRRLTESGGTPSGNNLANISFVGRLFGTTNSSVKVESIPGWSWNKYINGTNMLVFSVPTDISVIPNLTKYKYTDINNNEQSIYVRHYDNVNGILICDNNSNNPLSTTGTLTKVSSDESTVSVAFTNYERQIWTPFIDGNAFGFQAYANDYCGGSIDVIICFLSYLNQINPGGDMDSVLDSVKTFIDQIHSDFPDCKVLNIAGTGVSPNGGAGNNYGANANYTDYGILYDEFVFQQKLYDLFALDDYKDWCFIPNTLQEIDMENAFPTENLTVNLRSVETEVVQTNALHPDNAGNLMAADSVYRCFVCTVLN